MKSQPTLTLSGWNTPKGWIRISLSVRGPERLEPKELQEPKFMQFAHGVQADASGRIPNEFVGLI